MYTIIPKANQDLISPHFVGFLPTRATKNAPMPSKYTASSVGIPIKQTQTNMKSTWFKPEFARVKDQHVPPGNGLQMIRSI